MASRYTKAISVDVHLFMTYLQGSQGPAWTYTGCPRRNVPDFRRMFLMLKYTDITQNSYIQSGTVTEIMTREFWKF